MNTKWIKDIATALLGLVGLVLLLLCMALLVPEARADAFPTSQIASYLSTYAALPLAVGVPMDLAVNLVDAQREAWGSSPKLWQPGSLLASEDAVLRAIQLYVWPGGPTLITDDTQTFAVVWDQSNVAIDLTLTGGFNVTRLNFGAKEVLDPPTTTPEPGTWILMLMGLSVVWIVRPRGIAGRMRARLAAYRP